MKKWTRNSLAFLCFFGVFYSQNNKKVSTHSPRLVVGIVVDQMRQEYLYRFQHRFGPGGFKRLMREGVMCKDTRYDYVPTFTGPGHASIYTGTTPRFHGIVANDWYMRSEKKEVYCVDDASVQSVPAGYRDGKKSPHRLLCTNLSDQLRMTHPDAKVISVSLKDRSSILPAGHRANLALWLDDSSGHFISSSYYGNSIPEWVKQFNQQNHPKKILQNGWSTLYTISSYSSSLSDDFPYEYSPFGGKSVFPYDFSASGNPPKFLKYSPGGNTLLRMLATEAIRQEQLGHDEVPDFLWISFSSPDYVGHLFGPRSVELEDTYLRLDRELDTLLKTLDRSVGAGQYLLFLTADHGCSENIGYLKQQKIPSGSLTEQKISDSLKKMLQKEFGHPEWLEKVSNFLIYLQVPEQMQYEKVLQKVKTELLKWEGIHEVMECRQLKVVCPGHDFPEQLNKNGYADKLDADLIFTPAPGWLDYDIKGTTHGVCYSGDTHVPLLWFGHNLRPSQTHQQIYITQIAPTIAQILRIPLPSCSFANSIREIMRNYE